MKEKKHNVRRKMMMAQADLYDAGFRDSIVERKNGIDNLVDRLTLELDDAPAGSLRITNRKSYTQYYWRKDAKDTNGTYIHKDNIDVAKALAQKEYNKKLYFFLDRTIKTFTFFAFYCKKVKQAGRMSQDI